jgi:hypothetical protein
LVPIEEEPERLAFAFFAWRFSFRDLLAAVFELFEPPLSLLAIVTPSRRKTWVLNVALWESDGSGTTTRVPPWSRRLMGLTTE